MSELQREELDAKLTTIEAKTKLQAAQSELRMVTIEGKIDGITSLMNERSHWMDKRMAGLEASMSDLANSLRNVKSTLLITAISTALAVVFGVAAFNAVLLSNMLAAFESGKNMKANQAELQHQVEATAVLLSKLQQQMNQPPAPAPKK
ncbi:hypothetical protein ACFOLJ_20885 [Rugamonas sp. CCM 8940]|uniref:hypothetical protein n=1 Tax=Rugamonas sp. CCM 8940 TaxID=2765359 RepID=UPI0018F2821D|nr:hypothetical protein [Rugamonas sp. CCM 8940]MBJ7312230.1 hypothetical protein [Rugamonas sp. CCM 8940]